MQQALHIEISFDKVLQGDFGFLLNTLTTAFSYVCRLSEFQKVLLEVKSPSYAFLTFPFYTPPIGEQNSFCEIISVEVFWKLQAPLQVGWLHSFMIFLFLKQEPLELNYCESLWITWAICCLVVTWYHCFRTDICFDFFTE